VATPKTCPTAAATSQSRCCHTQRPDCKENIASGRQIQHWWGHGDARNHSAIESDGTTVDSSLFRRNESVMVCVRCMCIPLYIPLYVRLLSGEKWYQVKETHVISMYVTAMTHAACWQITSYRKATMNFYTVLNNSTQKTRQLHVYTLYDIPLICISLWPTMVCWNIQVYIDMLPIYHATRASPRENHWNLKCIPLWNSIRSELQTNKLSARYLPSVRMMFQIYNCLIRR
jgi:hypothetical protein